MDENFRHRLEDFIEGCRDIRRDYYASNGWSNQLEDLDYRIGGRYVKIFLVDRETQKPRSVYCFVDKQNGDVLKSASWKAPAKHARGNIWDIHNGLQRMEPHGAAYLK